MVIFKRGTYILVGGLLSHIEQLALGSSMTQCTMNARKWIGKLLVGGVYSTTEVALHAIIERGTF